MSFLTRVEAYAGPDGDHSAKIAGWLLEGVRDIKRKLKSINYRYLEMMGVWIDAPSTGLDTTEYLDIYSVKLDSGRSCRRIENKDLEDAKTSGHNRYCTVTYPGYVLTGGTLKCVSVGSYTDGEVFALTASNGDISSGAETIAYLPDEFHESVVLYTAVRLLKAKIADISEDDEDSEFTQEYQNQINDLEARYQSLFAGYGEQK